MSQTFSIKIYLCRETKEPLSRENVYDKNLLFFCFYCRSISLKSDNSV